MTREELTKEALQEMQADRERGFKANIKNSIRDIACKQREIVARQEELKELQGDFKKLEIESFDESILE